MSAIDIAVINALKGDATLTALTPGGWFRDVAPEAVVSAALSDPGQVFGIVTLQAATDSYAHGGDEPVIEVCTYLVKCIAPSTSPVGAQAAINRAAVVLRALRGSATIAGYAVSTSRRIERISYVESDGPVYWQHRGVSWFLFASPL